MTLTTTKTAQGYELTVNGTHYEITNTGEGFWQIATNGIVSDAANSKKEALELIEEWEA